MQVIILKIFFNHSKMLFFKVNATEAQKSVAISMTNNILIFLFLFFP